MALATPHVRPAAACRCAASFAQLPLRCRLPCPAQFCHLRLHLEPHPQQSPSGDLLLCTQGCAVPSGSLSLLNVAAHSLQEHGPGGKRFTFCIGKDASQPQRSRFLMTAKQVGAEIAALYAVDCFCCTGPCCGHGCLGSCRTAGPLNALAAQGLLCPWLRPQVVDLVAPIMNQCSLPINCAAGRAGRGAPLPQQPLPRPAVRPPALQHVCHPSARGEGPGGASAGGACSLRLQAASPLLLLR